MDRAVKREYSFLLPLHPFMRRHIHSARDFILPIIDFFYPPFRRLMNLQTFRYAASGGGNVLLGFLVYVISYKFIFAEKQFDFGFYAFKGHVAAMLVSFLVTFPVGFFMSKYVVFSDSNMKGKVQLVRYFVVCMFNLLLNYLLLKVFVETLKMNAILAQILTIAIVVVFSYLAQRNFSFKATPPGSEEDVTD